MSERRVLLIDRRFGPTGGAQRYLDRLALRLLAEGFTVEIAANSHPDFVHNFQVLQSAGIATHCLPLNESVSASASLLASILDNYRPHLLHVNTSCREVRQTLLRIRNWSKTSCKRVYTMHLSLVSDGLVRAASTWARLPWSYTSRRLRERQRYLDVFDTCITVSERNGQVVSSLLNVPTNKIAFIPNGVDVEAFRPVERPRKIGRGYPCVIGCCARLSTQKRHDVVLRALASLGSARQVNLRIAGEGPEEGRLKSLATELDLNGKVEFLGTQLDVPRFMRSLDLFVLMSDFEGLPYALLEAMATGLPTIVSDVNEMPCVVRDGTDGFVVPAGDTGACATRLSTLIDDPALRVSMGMSARRRMSEVYNEQQSLDGTLQLFQSLLASDVTS